MTSQRPFLMLKTPNFQMGTYTRYAEANSENPMSLSLGSEEVVRKTFRQKLKMAVMAAILDCR